MRDKAYRLAKAFWNESVKRIPYVLVILLFLLLYQNYNNGQKANTTLTKIASLGQQLKELGMQNKSLGQQNRNLSQQLNDKADNINAHVDCVVALFLPDKFPVTDADIQGCKVTATSPTSAITGSSASPQSLSSQSAQSSSSNTTPAPIPAQPDSSQPVTPNCTIDVLFIHIGKCN